MTPRFLLACAFALVGSASSAVADVIDFNWSYTGEGISAGGTFATTTTGTAGVYQITGITGQRNGLSITALDTTLGSPDELLYYPATDTGTALSPTFLDNNGFSYDIGADAYNIFTSIGRPSVVENDGGPAIVFTASPASVPEPLTVSIFGAGLLGAVALRRRKQAEKA